MRGWCGFSGPITEQNDIKPNAIPDWNQCLFENYSMFTFPVHWLFKHMVFLEKTLFVYHVPKITVGKKSDT